MRWGDCSHGLRYSKNASDDFNIDLKERGSRNAIDHAADRFLNLHFAGERAMTPA